MTQPNWKSALTGAVAALALGVAAVAISPADAGAQSQGQRAKGQGSQGTRGDQGTRGGSSTLETRILRGNGRRVIIILEEGDDDSDRPEWAQGNPEANPHAKAGGGKPSGAGTKKGDEYGDLIVLKRDLATGEPVMEDGEYLVCLTADCSETVPTVDGDVPDGVVPIEVDFGRASIARAPQGVIDKALADALEKLTATDVELGTDTSGRITYTIGDVTSTIDSPLENLALYINLMDGLASNDTSVVEALLGDLATLDTAAALLAGVADKTGDIGLDYVVYQNVITGVVASDEFYDFSEFTYTRSYPVDYTYWVSIDGAAPELKTLDINQFLAVENGDLPADTDYAALFAAAANDALAVIELVHTQIYTEILPGTIVTP